MSNGRLDRNAGPQRRSRIQVAVLVVAVVGISGAAIATGAAMTGGQTAAGPVQLNIVAVTTSAPGPTTPLATTAALGGAADTQTPTTITAAPTTPPPAGEDQAGGKQQDTNPGSGTGSGTGNSAHTPPPAAPPAKTTPPAPKPVNIGGQLTCSSGKSIEGVWVSTTNGSGYAPWQGLGNNVSKFWYTLPESEPYSVHVGCGGTQQYWAVACYGPQVTNPSDSFECFDVDGASGYETCKAK